MKIIDKTFGPDELIVSETAGTLTIELKGVILGTPEDIQVPINIVTILTALEGGITNPVVKRVFGLLLNML